MKHSPSGFETTDKRRGERIMPTKADSIWRILLLSVFLSAISIGCGSGNLNNYEKVKDGMTESEVDALLGHGEVQSDVNVDVPSKSISIPIAGNIATPSLKTSGRIKKWESAVKTVTVAFQDGKVVSKAMTDVAAK
jgi:hypothetical protein